MVHTAQAGAGLSGRIASFMGFQAEILHIVFITFFFLHPLEAPKDSECVIYYLIPSI